MSKRKRSQQAPAQVPRQVALPSVPQTPAARLSSAKIQEPHRQRLAIVYVRQSTPQQVMQHCESKARQYALTDQAKALGWSGERIVVIDEDHGHHQTNKAKGKPHEWCLPDLARKLRITISRMQRWRRWGWVHSRKIPGAPNRCFVWADKEELARLRRLRDCPIDRSHKFGDRYPKELTTPKPRNET